MAPLAIAACCFTADATASAAQGTAKTNATATTYTATVTNTPQVTIPNMFMGVSTDLTDGGQYLSNSKLDSYLKLITPSGEHLALSFGGTQADEAYWLKMEKDVKSEYRVSDKRAITLGPHFFQIMARTLKATGDKVLLSVNAAAHDPGMAASYIGAARKYLPSNSIIAAVIGDEPENYDWDRSPIADGHSWVKTFGPKQYDALYHNYADVIKNVPISGPATGSKSTGWTSSLLQADSKQVALMTEHFYPYNACYPPSNSLYPRLSYYMNPGLAASQDAPVTSAMSLVRSYKKPLRLTEFGTATCGGAPNVNNRFVTSLWTLNQMFALTQAGVNGVNYQFKDNTLNTALQLMHTKLSARPVFYGLMMFAQAITNGAQLETVSGSLPSPLRVWAVRFPNGNWRFVLINFGSKSYSVRLALPAKAQFTSFTDELLSGTGQSAELGGSQISANVTISPRWNTVSKSNGSYVLKVPALSAELADGK